VDRHLTSDVVVLVVCLSGVPPSHYTEIFTGVRVSISTRIGRELGLYIMYGNSYFLEVVIWMATRYMC